MMPTTQSLSADLVTFTEEILCGKFNFLCSVCNVIAQLIARSPANRKVSGSIQASTNLAYKQYSQGNPNCTVGYWELRLGMVLQLSNNSPWSSATEKGIESLAVRLIPTLSLSCYLLTYLLACLLACLLAFFLPSFLPSFLTYLLT